MDWERVEWAVELLGTVKITILTPFEKRLEWERGRAIKGCFCPLLRRHQRREVVAILREIL